MNKEEIEALKKRVAEDAWKRFIHTPYQEVRGRSADFVVEYEIDLAPELRSVKPSQGMRSDFLYKGDSPHADGIHMIWPEFLDESGQVITEKNPEKISPKGKANMWVLLDERRPYHAQRIEIGTEGFWVIGSFKLAKVRVIKIGSLKG